MPPPKPAAAEPQPIAASRARRAVQGRHRGGAWKVAYADFVTALMALFIVLWMMNATKAVKASIAGYFRDPRGYTQRLGAGPAGSGEGLSADQHTAKGLQQQIEAAMRQAPNFGAIRDHVALSVTGEGLRVDLVETERGIFFVSGRPDPTEAGRALLRLLAEELSRMPNRIAIEGHTDSRPFRNAAFDSSYGNWELSVDRANAARKLLQTYGLRMGQVAEVRGFADQMLTYPQDPNDSRNRRVSVVVRFSQPGQ